METPLLLILLATLGLMMAQAPQYVEGAVQTLEWTVDFAEVTRLCNSKTVMTVNGQYPGPTVHVTEGDTLIVAVTNMAKDDVTIHWHGVRQQLTCWSDGVASITQCPIRPQQTFTYNFTLIGQRGTLMWHAHKSWLRATVHGAIVIQPNDPIMQDTSPFHLTPIELPPLILGEWWIQDIEKDIVKPAVTSGGVYNSSDALTINGQPGGLYNCSEEGRVKYDVEWGQRYILRVINAAVNMPMFFGITNHTLTVVESDGEEPEAFEAEVVVIAPGQTLGLLIDGPNSGWEQQEYLIAGTAFTDVASFPETPTTALLRYHYSSSTRVRPPPPPPPSSQQLPLPSFPAHNDTNFAFTFFRDHLSRQRIHIITTTPPPPPRVPLHTQYNFLYTFGYGVLPCPPHLHCSGPFSKRFATAINNISFTPPTTTSILQAYYHNSSKGVYEEGFPDVPTPMYNFTGTGTITDPATSAATMVRVLPYNSTVEVVLQNTRTLFQESHPVHLHGHNFWVVATGLGDFQSDSANRNTFNLRNPISRNTVMVPRGGWAVIRFRTLNPGVWFLHCHLDAHQMWGMSMAFIVLNGQHPDEILPPPPSHIPTTCS